MADFIPIILDLEDSSRSTVILDEFPLPQMSNSKRIPTVTPELVAPKKQRNMKKLSVATGPMGAPRSAAQWKRALAEIKRDLRDRRYRACSLRCRELLEHVKSTVSLPVKKPPTEQATSR